MDDKREKAFLKNRELLLDSQLYAAFYTTTLKYSATCFCRNTRPKPVRTSTVASVGLMSSFRHIFVVL